MKLDFNLKNPSYNLSTSPIIKDPPYVNEYGWKCSQLDGTTRFYEWVYNCFKEGFNI